MSGLIASLQNISSALSVYNTALGAEQSNVSNSATPGYAAVRADIRPIGPGSSDIVTLRSTGSPAADAAVQTATAQSSYSQTTADRLDPVNQQFDITGASGILAAFQQFSTAFANVSVSPNDPALRTAALASASSVAFAFNSVAQNLDAQKNSIDTSIQGTIADVNGLAQQIAHYNVKIQSQSEVDPVADAAQREALDQLSSLVGITVTRNSAGGVTVLGGGSVPIVIGDHAYTLSANPDAAPGSQIASSGGGASPASFSGTLGALLDTRNNTITPILGNSGITGSLNTLALGFAARANTLLASGTTAAGAVGTPVFTYDIADPSNVARTLAIDPVVTQAQLGLASLTQSNGIANQLAGLAASNQPADAIDGVPPQDYFATIASDVGRRLSDARNGASNDHTSLTSALASRSAISGVSLDQEAVNLTAYQRSWQAAAKVISILDELTGDEVNLIR